MAAGPCCPARLGDVWECDKPPLGMGTVSFNYEDPGVVVVWEHAVL